MRSFAPLGLVLPFLIGCSLSPTAPLTSTPPTTPEAGIAITGTVHGGQQPVVGEHVYLFAANTSGSGGNGITASSSNASISLLNGTDLATNNGTEGVGWGEDASNNYYVITDANGNFTLTGDYTCTAGQQVYIYGVSGNTGSGTNSAAGLMAVLGSCPGPTFSSGLFVNMNEVSTIAAAYAMAGWATDATHVSSDAGVGGNAYANLATTGIANAFLNAANLDDITTGSGALATTLGSVSALTQVGGSNYTVAPTVTIAAPPNGIQATATAAASGGTLTFTITNSGSGYNAAPAVTLSGGTYTTVATATSTLIAGNGAVPQTTINTLANILAACVNTAGPGSSGCNTLLTNAKSAGSSGTTATDTATAAINIAHNPGTNITALYGLASTTPPFATALISQPNDFTLGINFTGGSLTTPYGLTIDASGNAWITNAQGGSVTKLSSTGSVLINGSSNAGTNDISHPVAIAIDQSGNAWIVNKGDRSITEFNSSGTPVSGSPYTFNNLNQPQGIAIDASGDVWITSFTSVFELNNSGTDLSNGGYTQNGYVNQPVGIAIDGQGFAWAASTGDGHIIQFFNGLGFASSFPGSGPTGGIYSPQGIAIDSAGNFWIANGNNSVSEYNPYVGGAISGNNGYTGGGMNGSIAIALDGAGDAWIGNRFGSVVTEFSNSGTLLSPTGYSGGSINQSYSIAIDGSGDVWVPNAGSNSVTELIGAATPVITPICAALPSTPPSDYTAPTSIATRP